MTAAVTSGNMRLMSAIRRLAICSCGNLRAVATGDPIRVSVCHCLACQQRTGSTYGFQARFLRQDVEVTGEATEYVRHADEDGDERRFYFCPTCGATLFYVNASEPDRVAIPVGAFADPSFPEPRFSVWESRRHTWVSVPADVEHAS